VTPTGAERSLDSSENQQVAAQSGAFSGALPARSTSLEPGLALLISRWVDLPKTLRVRNVALVQAADMEKGL
jgi:hypothetical protein